MPDDISEASPLRKAQERISTAQLIVARHRLRLAQLRQAECDSTLAETILLAMEECLRAMHQHEAQLQHDGTDVNSDDSEGPANNEKVATVAAAAAQTASGIAGGAGEKQS